MVKQCDRFILSSITFLINALPSWLSWSVLKDLAALSRQWGGALLGDLEQVVPVRCACRCGLFTFCCLTLIIFVLSIVKVLAVAGSRGSARVNLLLFVDKQLGSRRRGRLALLIPVACSKLL